MAGVKKAAKAADMKGIKAGARGDQQPKKAGNGGSAGARGGKRARVEKAVAGKKSIAEAREAVKRSAKTPVTKKRSANTAAAGASSAASKAVTSNKGKTAGNIGAVHKPVPSNKGRATGRSSAVSKPIASPSAGSSAASKPVASNKGAIAGKADSVLVRMYAHGFGDCFLLTFLSNDEPIYRMLIDCGMLTGDSDRLRMVINNIKETCQGHLDLVVQTHEHKDHISGFNLRDSKKNLLWDSIEVDKVWLAWTENTGGNGDELAIQLKQKQEQKKKALTKALQLYKTAIHQADHKKMLNKEYLGSDYYAAQQRYASALQQILEFFDIDEKDVAGMGANGNELGLTMKEAMGYFVNRCKKHGSPDISFWNPGDLADVKMTGLPGINFYFLGPPKDYDKLRVMEDTEHIEMYLTEMGLSDNFYMALTNHTDEDEEEGLSPFHRRYKWHADEVSEEQLKDPAHVWNLKHAKEHDWRDIETDWLHNAGALALNLDSYTNNTSLVIAIELEGSDKVLLFPADAQIGNWTSWTETVGNEPKLKWQVEKRGRKETVTASNLLERTVFYKVGHHASHNATARKHGLELMTSEELVAMIPVDEAVAKKQGKKGWKMPAEDLYQRLQEKTKSRIIRLDKGSLLANGIKDLPTGVRPTRQQLEAFNSCYSESDIIIITEEDNRRPLFFEYHVK